MGLGGRVYLFKVVVQTRMRRPELDVFGHLLQYSSRAFG